MVESPASQENPDRPSFAQHRIEDHGIIGDLRTAALVAGDGSIDFFCWPDFDSPSLFTALLDTPEAGIFQLAPDLPDARRQQIYLPETNVLQTRWLSRHAVVYLTDCMPICGEQDTPRLMRKVEVVSGSAHFRLRCAPRHDYARAATHADMSGGDVRFSAAGQPTLRLAASQPLQVSEDAAVCGFDLAEGETAWFVFGADDSPDVRIAGLDELLEKTAAYWRAWIAKSDYRGRWRGMVSRSALALKLLTSRQHGGIIAAATFGLPETPGGERNWDYRYTWVRDASFTVYAFMRLGLIEEAHDFMNFVRMRVSECTEGPDRLHILYSMDGRQELPEETLDHLRGYGGARPVRVGNEAYLQNQLDIYGELLDAVYLSNKYGEAISHDSWQNLVRVVDELCSRWREPDVGIWEMRGQEQHFLHSRLMCWVALDRAIRLATKRSLPAPFQRWDQERAAINADIWNNFWDDEAGHFVQCIGSRTLDGSMLLMPLMRFVGATDPRWLATLDAIGDRLVRNGFVYRYIAEETPSDALEGQEGAFVACSFWYVECLARAGRVDQAHLEFEQLLQYANPLGLYAEEFDIYGHHLGNTPQALSHLALISAASFLDRKLNGESIHWQP
jgi:GH15 family glucan-1,4-alpha-glucosidase